MTFMLESELVEPVCRYLNSRHFNPSLSEVPFYEYRMDIYGYSRTEDLTVAVELKLNKWSRAISQALIYQLCSDLVYIAMPIKVISRINTEMLQQYGIGLIAVEPERCKEIIPARKSSVLRQHYRSSYISLLGELRE